jgi:penicillin-binding protein 1A
MVKKIASYLFIACFLGFAFLGGVIFFFLHTNVVDFSHLERYKTAKPSIVLDDRGVEWARFQLDKREIVNLASVPAHVINAFLATEDHTFFTHHGISWKGMIRSALVNLYYGKKVQGASTITQQLVRMLFFDGRKTFERKLKEQWLAILVEHHYSKEQILETYLNNIYCGCGIYGIEAASQRFWGKPISLVTIDEAAVLAALVKSPAQYCPLLYPLSAQRRRDSVLKSMVSLGYITPAEYKESINKSVSVITQTGHSIGLHAKEMIRIQIERLVGRDQVYTGGLTVQTTLNSALQRKAERAFTAHIDSLRTKLPPSVDGGLLTVELASGDIKALIGGYDFSASQFNRVFQAKRQLGSVFKPLIYAAAVEKGTTFDTVAVDEPLHIIQADGSLWKPDNYSMTFGGPMTLASALTRSNNIITIKTLMEVGCERVVELAGLCRLSATLKPYYSLALGCVEAPLVEAVGMFNIFGNHGVYVEPHLISWVKDAWGRKIWKYSKVEERVLDAYISDQVMQILSLSMQRAQERWADEWIDSQAIGKSGTTNDCRTCLYIGSTPSYTTGIYIGCDDNRSLGQNVYGSTTAFPLWLTINKELESTKKKFSYDYALKSIVINSKNGRPCSERDKNACTILVSKDRH